MCTLLDYAVTASIVSREFTASRRVLKVVSHGTQRLGEHRRSVSNECSQIVRLTILSSFYKTEQPPLCHCLYLFYIVTRTLFMEENSDGDPLKLKSFNSIQPYNTIFIYIIIYYIYDI